MAGSTEWEGGLRIASAWGTALPVDASGELFKFESEALPSGMPEVIKDENVGEPLSGQTYQGNISVEGTINMNARFEAIDRWLALFMGEDNSANSAGETTIYDHTMVFQNSNTGEFATIVIDKSVTPGGSFNNLWEYPSCKVTQIELSHGDGKLMIVPTVIANKCERVTANQVAHAFGSSAYPSVLSLILFNHLTFYLQEVTGAEGNSAPADIVRVTDLKFTANRNLSGDHESGSAAGGVGAGEIGEPETDGLPEATLEFTIANHAAAIDALVAEAQTRQAGSIPKVYKAEAVWTGAEVAGAVASTTYQLKLQIANCTIAPTDINASGPGAKVPVTITMDIVSPQTLPDGADWTWCDTIGQKPFRFTVTNTRSASALT